MSAKDTLETVAGKITAMAEKSDEYVISAAILVHEARQRVKSGEAGPGVRWGGLGGREYQAVRISNSGATANR